MQELIGNTSEIRTFRDEFANESVCFFIDAMFPIVVDFAKLERNFKYLRYFNDVSQFLFHYLPLSLYQVIY
jgi:hypothetical protein